jgi:hypothetical protein
MELVLPPQQDRSIQDQISHPLDFSFRGNVDHHRVLGAHHLDGTGLSLNLDDFQFFDSLARNPERADLR